GPRCTAWPASSSWARAGATPMSTTATTRAARLAMRKRVMTPLSGLGGRPIRGVALFEVADHQQRVQAGAGDLGVSDGNVVDVPALGVDRNVAAVLPAQADRLAGEGAEADRLLAEREAGAGEDAGADRQAAGVAGV